MAGRVLGGTSNLNYNLYVRGQRKDYDLWAEQGAIGWSWKDIFGYFIRAENNTDYHNEFHGVGGPLTVSHSPYYSPLLKNFLGAVREMGLPIRDFNTDRHDSFYISQGTIEHGKRKNSYTAYVKPNLHRQNLRVMTSALVTKILIDEFKRAKGVSYEYFNVTKIVYARKEIIISAGTVNTAKLLMLSGIGPREHLHELGIAVVADLPVGKNFHDHVTTSVIFTIDKPYSLHTLSFTPKDITDYKFHGRGRVTSLAGVEVLGFLRTPVEKEGWSDILVGIAANSLSDTGLPLLMPQVGFRKDVYINAFSRYKFKHTISCMPIILRPKSRGFVKLKSSDPFDQPIINTNYFAKIEDLLSLIEGAKFCKTFGRTHSMREVGTQEIESVFPMCEHHPRDSDEYLGCVLRVFTVSLYHGSGTCKMGDPHDPRTVVDPNLRVKGVRNLRVADCSVMPTLVGGLPHATAVMIGEKAADLIRLGPYG
ncbi:glucose dehydrogenase [FAD, quinone]-like [Centruroides vittatus]|uniref:glucose dehydrogenase [FAD, quinone]-like n=1 Tax=Centruroides vittatus TaxID=120091 RepID=UPI003510AB57